MLISESSKSHLSILCTVDTQIVTFIPTPHHLQLFIFCNFSVCLPPTLTTHLSSILHRKTAGSPLFLRSFLSDGMIRFNLTTRRFDYDTRQILTKQIPPETVQYLASRMSQLPQSYRLVLKLASCLGFQFDAATFIKARVSSISTNQLWWDCF